MKCVLIIHSNSPPFNKEKLTVPCPCFCPGSKSESEVESELELELEGLEGADCCKSRRKLKSK